jgi:ABC-type multidrug transport system ATPase subunit
MGAGTGLLVWLHTLVESPPWTIILALLSLAWLFGVRELWYAFRFVKGWPPVRKTPGAWRQWLRLRRGKASGASEEAVPATPMDFPRSGGLLFILLFVGFLQLRIQVPGFTIAVAFLSLALYQLHRIGRRIEQGRIDPEHPVGRLRRMKRFVYSLVRALPVIRPAETQITALNGVSLEIGSGMLGLLGPNGAGKTTLMRILVGVLEQNRGSVYINGKKLDHNREIFHGAIGYLPQGFGLYETMTPYAFLENHALINGIYETGVRTRLIEETLKGVGLWDRRHDRISAFSGGMKQRVGIAQTLLHLPQIIVVDEPTVGLDPRERIRFRNLLAELAKERIVVFSTHIVEDVASTCRDLAVLFGGELLYRGSPEQLIHRAAGKVYETTVQEEQFEAWRQRLHVVNHIKIEEGIRMRFVAGTPEEGCIQENGAVSAPPNLEDAYVYLLREKQRQDARS